MSMRRVASMALVVVLVTAACTTAAETTTSTPPAGDSTTLPPPPPSDEPGEPEPPTTETTEPTTQVTEPGSPETTIPSTTEPGESYHPIVPIGLAPPDPLPGSDGAAGSGCAPAADELPDGVWFVFMVESRPDTVVGDLACFWFGDIAYEVGEAAGEEVANDYYISNESDRARTTPVTTDTVVWTLAGDPTKGHVEVAYAEWPSATPGYVECPGDFCTIWLYVNDGVVTDIVEQYLP